MGSLPTGAGRIGSPDHHANGERPGNREELYKFRDVNFARVAEEIGCLGVRVERPEEIAGALQKALAAERPVIIDVVTNPDHLAPEPWAPK